MQNNIQCACLGAGPGKQASGVAAAEGRIERSQQQLFKTEAYLTETRKSRALLNRYETWYEQGCKLDSERGCIGLGGLCKPECRSHRCSRTGFIDAKRRKLMSIQRRTRLLATKWQES